jgi:hypothetical protein
MQANIEAWVTRATPGQRSSKMHAAHGLSSVPIKIRLLATRKAGIYVSLQRYDINERSKDLAGLRVARVAGRLSGRQNQLGIQAVEPQQIDQQDPGCLTVSAHRRCRTTSRRASKIGLERDKEHVWIRRASESKRSGFLPAYVREESSPNPSILGCHGRSGIEHQGGAKSEGCRIEGS